MGVRAACLTVLPMAQGHNGTGRFAGQPPTIGTERFVGAHLAALAVGPGPTGSTRGRGRGFRFGYSGRLGRQWHLFRRTPRSDCALTGCRYAVHARESCWWSIEAALLNPTRSCQSFPWRTVVRSIGECPGRVLPRPPVRQRDRSVPASYVKVGYVRWLMELALGGVDRPQSTRPDGCRCCSITRTPHTLLPCERPTGLRRSRRRCRIWRVVSTN